MLEKSKKRESCRENDRDNGGGNGAGIQTTKKAASKLRVIQYIYIYKREFFEIKIVRKAIRDASLHGIILKRIDYSKI